MLGGGGLMAQIAPGHVFETRDRPVRHPSEVAMQFMLPLMIRVATGWVYVRLGDPRPPRSLSLCLSHTYSLTLPAPVARPPSGDAFPYEVVGCSFAVWCEGNAQKVSSGSAITPPPPPPPPPPPEAEARTPPHEQHPSSVAVLPGASAQRSCRSIVSFLFLLLLLLLLLLVLLLFLVLLISSSSSPAASRSHAHSPSPGTRRKSSIQKASHRCSREAMSQPLRRPPTPPTTSTESRSHRPGGASRTPRKSRPRPTRPRATPPKTERPARTTPPAAAADRPRKRRPAGSRR
ncbi:hypothetical protein LX36DRAFT_279275 [Colletotrichum falcatum]|nr:hypothetical protein LX36DRAFT_279275 [Colletotrichum falcatum]